jgi:hypothetical protein
MQSWRTRTLHQLPNRAIESLKKELEIAVNPLINHQMFTSYQHEMPEMHDIKNSK